MLTRVLSILVLSASVVFASFGPHAAQAEETKVLALGLSEKPVTEADIADGKQPPVPRFNTPAVAYVLVGDVKKGDIVEVALKLGARPLHQNSETLEEDKATFLLQAGRTGVPTGGWPEGTYHAEVKVTHDGKTLIEQQSEPIAFE
jgi:hypothetical protein